jgi:hypothetical protein
MGDLTFSVLKTFAESPFYKNMLRQAVNEFFDAERCEREVKEILFKDLEFTVSFLSILPRTANTFFGAVRGFGGYANSFAPDALLGVLKGVSSDFNASYAAQTVNELFDLFDKLGKSHPNLFVELMGDKIEEFVDNLDFGKLRRFVESAAYCMQGTVELLNEKVVADPVKIANIVASLPAIVNTSIAIANDTVRRVDLPAEVLASATFSVIENLNTAEIGRLAENTAKLVNRLHEGNYILGRGDAKFKDVAEKFFEGIFENADAEELKKSLLALLEDFEALSEALNNAIWKNPIVAITAISTIPAAVNAIIRTFNSTVSKLEELPEELFAQTAVSLMSEIDTKEIGNIVTSCARLLNSITENDPKAISGMINSIISSTNKEELGKALNNLISSFVDVLLSNPELLTAAVNPLIQSVANIVKVGGGER